MKEANKGPLDIVDVKAGIRAGRLFVQIKDNHLLLGDFMTGEAVLLSDIEVKPTVHASQRETGFGEAWYNWGDCTNCGCSNIFPSNYCCNCGARMDGDPHDDSGQ